MSDTPTPRTDEIRTYIPDWDDVMDKLSKHEKINPIEQFVWDYAPSDSESPEWENSLFKAIKFLNERELSAVTEQRNKYTLASEHLNQMLNKVTEQRDRLADRLRESNLQLQYLDEKYPSGTTPTCMTRNEEALQSLNQNETNPAAGSK